MSWAHQTLRSFGASLNIEGLHFNARGICVLRDAGDTTIGIEDKGNGLIVYVSRKIPFAHENIMAKILARTHYKSTLAIPVGACLSKDEQLVVFSYMTINNGTSQYMYETIKKLYRILEECVHE